METTEVGEKRGLATQAGYQVLGLTDINSVAQGACFLASGGGGSLQLALNKIIPAFFNDSTQINLIGLDALNWPGDWGAVVAGIGSPLKLFQEPTLVKSAITAYKTLSDLCFAFKSAGQTEFQSFELMDFCLPVEIGAVNSIVPMIVAAGASPVVSKWLFPVFVVDADGAGRAVPTLPLTTFARQLNLYPNVIGGSNKTEPGSDQFDYGSLNVQDEKTLEAAFLGMIGSGAFGDVSGLAIYASNGEGFQACKPVPNGVSDALELGQIIQQSSATDRVNRVLNYITSTMNRQARQIFYGQVTDMKEATSGLDNGYVQITGMGTFSGQTFKLLIENENIWAELKKDAQSDYQPWIVGPDSMNYLTDTGDVFDNSDLWKLFSEQKERPIVSIIGMEAAPMVKGNSKLMAAWAEEVQTKGGPGQYINPWMNGV